MLEEHAFIRLQEEEFWALKSRLNAATFGDRNTSYFHITTVVRRQRNKIRSIMDGSGEWLYDEEKIKDHIQQGFSKLYSSEMCMVRMDSPIANFSYCFLSEEERGWMGRVVDEEEIKLPYGPLSLLRPLDLMDYMLVFSNIFGEMCKFQFVMKLKRLFPLELFLNF